MTIFDKLEYQDNIKHVNGMIDELHGQLFEMLGYSHLESGLIDGMNNLEKLKEGLK